MRDDREVVFYMDAWTFGYEDVWRALAAHLQTKIHLDEYRSRLYRCLGNRAECFTPETAALVGFQLGNHYQKGCLSYEREGCRVHSCERGTRCSVFDDNNVVRITPIITRHQGLEYAELGAGGGQGDLDQVHELELNDIQVVAQLMALCSAKLAGKESLPKLLNLLAKHLQSGGTNIRLDTLSLLEQHGGEGDADGLEDMDKIPLDRFLPVLAKLGVGDGEDMVRSKHSPRTRQITFPYSRHSSYSELRYLVQAFKPKDVYPCTVDERTWNADVSMKSLFGDLCSGESFIHDQFMYNMLNLHRSDADSQVQGEESRRVERTPSPASTPSPERLHANQKRTESASRSASVGRENSVKKRAKLSSPSTLRSTPRSRLEDGLAQRKRAHDAALGAGGSSWSERALTVRSVKAACKTNRISAPSSDPKTGVSFCSREVMSTTDIDMLICFNHANMYQAVTRSYTRRLHCGHIGFCAGRGYHGRRPLQAVDRCASAVQASVQSQGLCIRGEVQKLPCINGWTWADPRAGGHVRSERDPNMATSCRTPARSLLLDTAALPSGKRRIVRSEASPSLYPCHTDERRPWSSLLRRFRARQDVVVCQSEVGSVDDIAFRTGARVRGGAARLGVSESARLRGALDQNRDCMVPTPSQRLYSSELGSGSMLCWGSNGTRQGNHEPYLHRFLFDQNKLEDPADCPKRETEFKGYLDVTGYKGLLGQSKRPLSTGERGGAE
ncbi:hypothetical protein M8818_005341 [Zalaria obscura]|uniref:Uncharacterized protein n=1 Tax=Zalaria obscura TaxID=2024903 RepID=A0ACC3SA56_9PEZI